MSTTNQGDLFTPSAKQARDEALAMVAANAGDWKDQAYYWIGRLQPGEYTGEDIRLKVTTQIGPPHHHNVWGALIRSAIKYGWLHPTGEYRSMKTTKSHARRTPVYRRF